MNLREQIAMQDKHSVAVLGNGEEFVLVALDGPIESAMSEGKARGFVYCGCMGVIDGRAVIQCESTPGAAITMLHAAVEFGQQVAERLKPHGDAVEWLERLYRLPDTQED